MRHVLRLTCLAFVFISVGSTPAYCRYYRRSSGYRSSPAAQMMNGWANVIRAQSQARLMDQQTRAKMIENRRRWAEVYYDRKRNHEAYVSEHTRLEKESLLTYLEHRPSGAPRQLSFSEFDPATGRITWPVALQSEEYARYRGELDELFAIRSHTSATTQLAQHIKLTTADLRAELQKHIDAMPPTAYIPARKFLDSLSYEGSRI